MMTRHRTTQLVTVLVLVAALGIGLVRKAGWRTTKAPPEPQDAVYAMLAAARTGDVKAYLACYTGQLQATLRQAVKESTEPGFAKYLRDTPRRRQRRGLIRPSEDRRTGDHRAGRIHLPGPQRGANRLSGKRPRRLEDRAHRQRRPCPRPDPLRHADEVAAPCSWWGGRPRPRRTPWSGSPPPDSHDGNHPFRACAAHGHSAPLARVSDGAGHTRDSCRPGLERGTAKASRGRHAGGASAMLV